MLVALSAPAAGAACATYAGAGADAMTIHYERGFGKDGPLRPLRRPWSYPGAYDREVPRAASGARLQQRADRPRELRAAGRRSPSRIAAALRDDVSRGQRRVRPPCGPGHSRRGRGRRVTEASAAMRISTNCRRSSRSRPRWPRRNSICRRACELDAPRAERRSARRFRDSTSVYAATSGSRFVALAIGSAEARRPCARTSRTRRSRFEIAATGKIVKRLKVDSRARHSTLGGYEALVLIGRA